jgi:thiamine-monophosphate kinase
VNETLAERGEFALIDALRSRLPVGRDIELGPGDDAAVIAAPDGRVVATTDVLVEGLHFRRDWSSAYDVGRKAAAQNLADVAAMGALGQALLVGFAAPSDLPVEWALSFADGLADECAAAGGVSVAGGDVVAAPQLVLSITALGSLEGRSPVLRSGARVDDVVAVCGRLGWSAAGWAVFRRGFRSPKTVVDAHRQPAPPYDAGPEAARLGATAMIDVSDGLLADLGHVARGSGVSIALDSAAFDVAEPLLAVAAATGEDALAYVLTGGEDHALVATFPAGVELPERWRIVGRVRAGEPAVLVDGESYAGEAGHVHFGIDPKQSRDKT